jgi:hypothetical protein
MGTSNFVERFKREARAAGQLRHPNVVDVTDFGIVDCDGHKIAYLVMEYLEGSTLHEALPRGRPIPLRLAVEILEQVCSAVHADHLRGIVHRDLKPANIWLEPNPLGGYRVKVLDFGLAKIGIETETETLPDDSDHSPPIDRNSSPSAPALTHAGAVLGTPPYMSPEQCRGESADKRSDIYSVGVIAYQMLTGRRPFEGNDELILRAHQVDDPPPIDHQRGRIPRGVSKLILEALDKDPKKRPESARAFAELLHSRTEGLWALYRRAFTLYSQYFPEIIKLSLLAHLPVFLVTALTIGLLFAKINPHEGGADSISIGFGVLRGLASFVTSSTIAGLVAIIVTGLAGAPLRPISLGSAFGVLQRRWFQFFCTGLLTVLLIMVGLIFLVVPGLVILVHYFLWAPVVLMEEKANWKALRRARELAGRSWRMSILAVLFQFIVPSLFETMVRRILPTGFTESSSIAPRVMAELSSLGSVLILPLVSIVAALVYIKMRQAGGQDLPPLLDHIDGTGSVAPKAPK